MDVSSPPPPSSSCSSPPQSLEPFLRSIAEEAEETHINEDYKTKRKTKKKKKKKRAFLKDTSATSTRSSTPDGKRVACIRRCTRVAFGRPRKIDVAEKISFRLGMSIAAFVSQILESKDTLAETISANHLSVICASAVRESLANDFGDAFDSFVRGFENSFQSTFRTLKLIRESSINKGNSRESILNVKNCSSRGAYTVPDCHSEERFNATEDRSDHSETMEGNEVIDSINLELALHGQMNQLTCVSPSPFGPTTNRSMLSTIEKSLMEQTRSNDLKTVELSLAMEKMEMKRTQLALNFDSNNLERSKLAMGASKASFKAEKFKTQLEDVRNAELLRKCVDCLVAGLLLMAGSLTYGAYVYSYHKITEATASCMPSTKDSNSWWLSNPMAKFNSGMQTLSCQFQVVIRMLFGFFMILLITYLLLKRSGSSKQTLPITFIILLLALLCGIAGKICVDTLGGSGYHWLAFWETLCIVHFFCNVYTSTLFAILYGPLTTKGTKDDNPRLAYWIRRLMFYIFMLIFLPLLCGLVPFASIGEWKDHFVSQIADYPYITED